eukprot:m.357123 g.357123  ORF g.357123 m.357123 type:complete len:127 (-) comp19936_c0_seq3:118-498(-)
MTTTPPSTVTDPIMCNLSPYLVDSEIDATVDVLIQTTDHPTEKRRAALVAAASAAKLSGANDTNRHLFVFGLAALRAEYLPAVEFVKMIVGQLSRTSRSMLGALASAPHGSCEQWHRACWRPESLS